MDRLANETAYAPTLDPGVLPDVATEPRPSAHVIPPESGAGEGLLQAALPEIQEAARKVGGLKNLSEIAEHLHQVGAEA
jgi:hypothetical protein